MHRTYLPQPPLLLFRRLHGPSGVRRRDTERVHMASRSALGAFFFFFFGDWMRLL